MPGLPRHRRSIRLTGYDYRDGGMYFVTLCTKNQERIFGEIQNGVMWMNTWGCVVLDELQKTPIIRPYVHLDTWIIMPNHVHVLLYMDDHVEPSPPYIPSSSFPACVRTTRWVAQSNTRATHRVAPTPETDIPVLKPQSLGSIIGQFKSISTKRINALRDSPGAAVWHRNYYERIVRSEQERVNIQRYILNNPAQWEIDDEYH